MNYELQQNSQLTTHNSEVKFALYLAVELKRYTSIKMQTAL